MLPPAFFILWRWFLMCTMLPFHVIISTLVAVLYVIGEALQQPSHFYRHWINKR